MISVRRVSKSFGRVRAVGDASFEVPRGRIVGLLGANGAGKSTTIRMIAGFLPPDAGSIQVEGFDTVGRSLEARRRLGYLPEAAPAYLEMSAEGYLEYRGRLFGLPRRRRLERVEMALARCELRDVRRRRIGQLSKGYRQRVGLAAAILHDPPVLVLDEPANALDPRQIGQTRRLIRELGQDKAVLVSSHILAEVEQMCDRVVIMARGCVRLDAAPAELVHAAGNCPYLARVRPPAGGDLDACVRALRAIRGVDELVIGESEEGWTTLRAIPADVADVSLGETIAAAIARAGCSLRELRREVPTLERVFLELIAAEDGASGAAA